MSQNKKKEIVLCLVMLLSACLLSGRMEGEPRIRRGLTFSGGLPPGTDFISPFLAAGLSLDGPRYRGKPRINLELATWMESAQTVTVYREEKNRRYYSFSFVVLRRLEGLPIHFLIGFGSSIRFVHSTIFRKPPETDYYQYVSKRIENEWLVSFFPSLGFAIPITSFFRLMGEFRLDWSLQNMETVRPVLLGGFHIIFPSKEPVTFFRSN